MQEFLDFVLRQLVEFPDEILIVKLEQPKKIIFKVRLQRSDVGKVLGKHGQTLTSIQNLLNAAASRHGQRVSVDLVESNTTPA